MKTTIQNIINAYPLLERLSEEPLPSRTAFVISKHIHEIKENYTIFETQRINLLESLGAIVDKETGNYKFPADVEKSQQIEDELNDLLSEEVTLTGRKIRLSEIEQVTITPQELTTILWLIDPDDE